MKARNNLRTGRVATPRGREWTRPPPVLAAQCQPKSLPVGDQDPHLTHRSHSTHHPKWHLDRLQSAVLPQLTIVTNGQTDRQTEPTRNSTGTNRPLTLYLLQSSSWIQWEGGRNPRPPECETMTSNYESILYVTWNVSLVCQCRVERGSNSLDPRLNPTVESQLIN